MRFVSSWNSSGVRGPRVIAPPPSERDALCEPSSLATEAAAFCMYFV